MKKQILSMLLAIVMVVGLIPGFAVTISADESGTDNSSYLSDIDEGIKTVEKGTYVNGFAADGNFQPAEQDADDTYLIANAGQLYWFAEQVNSGNTAINGKLVADIVVNENVLKEDGTLNDGSFRSWTSLGNADNPYTGKFGGQNHTISGLYYNTNYSKEIALFGRLKNGSIIQNLGLVDSWFYASGQNIGGIATACSESSIKNCYNASSIRGLSYVGGITANATYNSVVENCYNFGKITGSEIPVTDNGDGTYTYEQPDSNVSVAVSFCVKIYKVIFEDDNGTVLDEQNVEHGKSAAAPVDPTRIGYTFTGWDKYRS